jgi:hypothetical protein
LKTPRTKSTGIVSVLLTIATATGALGLNAAGAAQSAQSVGTHSSTTAVTVKISSTVAHPGKVVIQEVGGTNLGTCFGPKKKGTTSCVIHVPTSKTAVFVAQPSTRVGLKSWAGACGSAPGLAPIVQ